MFTFSFGSAFGATEVPGTATTHAEAMAQAEKEIVDSFNKNIAAAKTSLAAEYKETVINKKCTIAGSVYAATLDEIAKNFADIVKIAAQKVDKEQATVTNVELLKTAIKAVTDIKPNLAYNGNSEITVDVNDLADLTAAELVSYVTVAADYNTNHNYLQSYYMVFTWTNALSAMKDYLNGEIAKIDMSLYTNDVADKNDPYKTTWAQLAEKKKADLLDAVADTTINIGMGQTDSYKALQAMYKAVLTDGLVAYKTVNTISGGTVVVSYKLAGTAIKTKEDLANTEATTSAEKAALKALVQQNAATAYKDALAAYNAADKSTAAAKKAAQDALDAAKEKIDAFSANRIVLIDEDYIKTADRVAYTEALGQICLDRQKKYEALEKAAAAYKLQVEKDGSLTYVASIIDENLAKAKPIVFNGDVYAEAQLIVGAKNEASNLAWEKEVEVAKLNDAMDAILYAADGSDLYYAPEKAKVEAAYQKMIDKVNAAETSQQLKALNKAVSLAGIDNKAAVNSNVAGFLNTTKFMEAVNNYVDYLNIGIASYADGYRELLDLQADKADVAEYLAENGARANADIAGLFAKAEEYARAIPTNADKKAEKAAVDELVKALPNVITVADKDAVKAAWEAADKADYMPTKLATAVALLKAAEEKAIDDMIAALPKTITTADKAAVAAIQDAVKAFKNEPMYMTKNANTGKLEKAVYGKQAAADKAFTDLRAAEKAAVEAAIAALPADATAAQVKAARDAVDAFVKDYTDASEPYQAIAEIKNLDKLTYLEAQAKANQIAAVEALKITARSTPKKGSITVKWSVVGEADIDGYQIWKSTKANKGYKKAFTTTKKTYKNSKGLKKGTRYYYKVRAYKVIDGKNVYSDWSNKANRKAK